ncbi:hypothetical protein C8R47DRAFT_618839 [Mycena vitilis]|nr:hypothetical protein C8R47DRAFT_618839 [Mycena vitilis]
MLCLLLPLSLFLDLFTLKLLVMHPPLRSTPSRAASPALIDVETIVFQNPSNPADFFVGYSLCIPSCDLRYRVSLPLPSSMLTSLFLWMQLSPKSDFFAFRRTVLHPLTRSTQFPQAFRAPIGVDLLSHLSLISDFFILRCSASPLDGYIIDPCVPRSLCRRNHCFCKGTCRQSLTFLPPGYFFCVTP